MKQLPREDRKSLNLRLGGYDRAAVQRLWEALGPKLLEMEHRALRLDLFFPLLYGAAFAVSLLLAWRLRTPPIALGWVLLPVAILVLADWTENLVQLRQLRRYRQAGPEALEDNRMASAATRVKLLFFAGCSVLVVLLLIPSS